MNKKICDKTSNNKYFNCPPRMDDARHFTDYRPNTYVNNLIRMTNNVSGSYEYRQFLIHNADSLMKANTQYADMKNACSPCNATPVPFKQECNVGLSEVECRLLDPNGVGTRYSSSLK